MPVVVVSPRLSWQSLRVQGGSQEIRSSTKLFHPAASSLFSGLSLWFSSRYLLVLRPRWRRNPRHRHLPDGGRTPLPRLLLPVSRWIFLRRPSRRHRSARTRRHPRSLAALPAHRQRHHVFSSSQFNGTKKNKNELLLGEHQWLYPNEIGFPCSR